jgi:hypothetical protein
MSTRILRLEPDIPYSGNEACLIVNAINTAIVETEWQNTITDNYDVRRPNPKNQDLITSFLKRFGKDSTWQQYFQDCMRDGLMSRPSPCSTWKIFKQRFVNYARNIHSISSQSSQNIQPSKEEKAAATQSSSTAMKTPPTKEASA